MANKGLLVAYDLEPYRADMREVGDLKAAASAPLPRKRLCVREGSGCSRYAGSTIGGHKL